MNHPATSWMGVNSDGPVPRAARFIHADPRRTPEAEDRSAGYQLPHTRRWSLPTDHHSRPRPWDYRRIPHRPSPTGIRTACGRHPRQPCTAGIHRCRRGHSGFRRSRLCHSCDTSLVILSYLSAFHSTQWFRPPFRAARPSSIPVDDHRHFDGRRPDRQDLPDDRADLDSPGLPSFSPEASRLQECGGTLLTLIGFPMGVRFETRGLIVSAKHEIPFPGWFPGCFMG